MAFGKHPSQKLQDLFSQKPFQLQEPEKAQILFLGLDANFDENIESDSMFNEFVTYLKDGVGYWKKEGFHTPMLKDYYKGAGKRYHKQFTKLAFTSKDAENICFLELLNVCTYGNSTDMNGKTEFERLLLSETNRPHLERIKRIAKDKNKVMGTSKNSLSESFSRFLRVVSRYNSATYNIAFSKLPLKTEVFRGSLIYIYAEEKH